MKNAVAIRIQNLSKSFSAPINIDGTKQPSEAWRTLTKILGIKSKSQPLKVTMSANQVLQDINLEIEVGSVICLNGRSGSGKSVLLKILAGVLAPSTGRIELYGQVSSLLSIGDNLNPQFTAYENFKRYQQTLRISGDLDACFVEAINFAELKGFEHVPVRTYSTGMRMRLSIALALFGNPSILLIDDILGVGDIAFQQKCIARLYALKEEKRTLVIVLRDENHMQQLATQIITLSAGRITEHQSPLQWDEKIADIEWKITSDLPHNEVIAFRSISVNTEHEANKLNFYLSFEVESDTDLFCRPLIDIKHNKVILLRTLYPQNFALEANKRVNFTVKIPLHIFNSGNFIIMCGLVAFARNTIYSLKAMEAVNLCVRREGVVKNFFKLPHLLEVEQIG